LCVAQQFWADEKG